MYLSDLSNTRGHVGAITGAMWHPTDKKLVMTGSADGTMRIWDINKPSKQQSLIKVKNSKNTRGQVQTCTYNPDGKQVAAVGVDCDIQIFDVGI